ncbi:MAG TPA: hypothetical protein VMU59_00745 [Caulobacteraceae bacterium]|nr:hypothetical protein [Caulobacteraceae bacterium]
MTRSLPQAQHGSAADTPAANAGQPPPAQAAGHAPQPALDIERR